MKTWHFSTELTLSVHLDENGLTIGLQWVPDEIEEQLLPFMDSNDCEMVVSFDVDGSYSPGCWYMPNGDPGYPDEWDEERIVTSISIGDHVLQDSKKYRELFGCLDSIIDEYELDESLYEDEDY